MHIPTRSTSAARWPTLAARPGLPPAGLAALAIIAGSAAAALVIVAGPVLALLLAVGGVALYAAAAMPGFLFAAYLLIPFYKGAVQPYLPIDITVVLAAANVLQIIPVLLDSRPRKIWRAGVALWIGLGALVLAGIFYAPDQGLALGAAVTFWALVTLPLLAAGLRVGSDPRLVRQFVWSFFGMGVATVVLGLAELSGANRLIILGMDTIQVSLAALFVPLFGVSFVLLEGRPAVRTATIVVIPAAFVVALASGSRGPLLLFLVLAGLVGLRQLVLRRAVHRRLVGAVAGAVVMTVTLVAFASALLPALSIERFALFGSFVQSLLAGSPTASTGDTSSEARVRLFSLAVTIFTDHPLLGAGPTGFQVLSPIYVGPLLADRYPHNALLQFAAEFGLVGVTLFLAMVALAITRGSPPGRAWWSVRIAFAFILLNSMVSGNILEDRLFWGLLLLLLLLPRVVRTGAESTSHRDPSIASPPVLPARTRP
jgi:O-antigen ligase